MLSKDESDAIVSVQLSSISKEFKDLVAVNSVDLEIQDGEFFVLLGPSGCGKTTTLRLIAGLEAPTTGSVKIDGRDVTYVAPREREIAMVFQDYGLYPHMNAFQNIGFPLKIRKMSKGEIESCVRKTAERLNVSHLLRKRPSQMSGGERQRVALARALVRNPRVFLLDEPLSNLDAQLRAVMRTEIKQLASGLGITTVYVTHDQVEAMAMADRMAVMNRGRVEQVGSPLEIYDTPKTRFVAQFIGSPPMNLFDAHFAPSGRLKLDTPYLESLIQVSRLENISHIYKDREVKPLVGVRPEHIHLDPDTENAGVKAVIEHVELLGKDTVVFLRVEDKQIVALSGSREFQIDGVIGVRVNEEDVRLIEDHF